MGAYAPTRLVTPEMLAEYEESIVRPTLAGLKAEGIEFRGTLYVGLMLTNAGPKVLEFNVRFGDPETQVILPLLDDDLVPLLLASARGEELPDSVRFKEAYAMVVVLASAGYPESYPKGEVISTPSDFPEGSQLIHAGTKLDEEGKCVTAGGRVLGAVGMGSSLQEARERANAVCDSVDFLRNISAGTSDIANFQETESVLSCLFAKGGREKPKNGKEEQSQKGAQAGKVSCFYLHRQRLPESDGRETLRRSGCEVRHEKENPRLLGRHIGHGR